MTIDVDTAVSNVLSGRSADGAKELRSAVSFTGHTAVRQAFSGIVAQIVSNLHEAAIDLTIGELTALIFKLAAHASKVGWQSPQSIQNLAALSPSLVDAISEKRGALGARLNVDGMLRAHAIRSAQRLARKLRQQPDSDPPTVILHGNDTDYALVELTTPAHLIAESGAMGHCVGTLFAEGILRAKNLPKNHPDATWYLTYALKIRSRELRIFSLRHRGKPCATIAYNQRRCRIDQIEARTRQLIGDEAFFPALCETAHALSRIIDIRRIRGVPPPCNETVLTKNGRYLRHDQVSPADILVGSVIHSRDVDVQRLQALCACRRLTLSLSNADLVHLPSHVQANLVTDAIEFDAPQLKHADSIYACSARRFVVPGLQSAGTIEVHNAELVEAPNLQTCAYMDAQGATNLSLPDLQKVDTLVTNNVPAVALSRLRAATGNIFASGARSFAAPLLQHAHHIHLDSLQHADLPRLQIAHDIYINAARSFHLPALETANNIHADRVEQFDVPRLRQAAHISAGNAKRFSAPRLRDVKLVQAISADIVDAPGINAYAHITRPAG